VLDELARDVQAHTVAAAIARALGAEQASGDRPDWSQVRDRFDELLAEAPDAERPETNTPKAIILRAVGLR
jgi:hypothetical protein